MINAVAYCRVSTDQEDQLKSLKIQKELFEAYAQKNGLNLIHIYSHYIMTFSHILGLHHILMRELATQEANYHFITRLLV